MKLNSRQQRKLNAKLFNEKQERVKAERQAEIERLAKEPPKPISKETVALLGLATGLGFKI